MRLAATVGLFGVVVFGVGWTARAVWQPGTADAAAAECERCASPHPDHHRGPGPILGTVDRLEAELDLSGTQHDDLRALIDETVDLLAANDRARKEIYQESGRRVRALLSREQMETLAAVTRGRMDAWNQRCVDAAGTFAAGRGLAPAATEEVVAAVAEYQQVKADLFQATLLDAGEAPVEDCSSLMQEAYERYQSRLEAVLDAEGRAALRAALLATCETKPTPSP